MEDVQIEASQTAQPETKIFVIRTTAGKEDQVADFLAAYAAKRKAALYSIIAPHELSGYLFVEAESKSDVDMAIRGIPYAKGVLDRDVPFKEIEHMLEVAKKQDIDVRKNDIVEIISGAFKREKAKVIRVDTIKHEVVVTLLDAAVNIPMTLKMDHVKVVRREGEKQEEADA